MRVSAHKDDPGYANWQMMQANSKRVSVLLDGEECVFCETADEEQGFVVRCVPDSEGNPQVDPIDRNCIWTERVTGKVEIKVEDQPRP